jgi:nuclear pore complex protein Nup155
MIKMVGHNQSGRIFMGGQDGCLYELLYQGNPIELFSNKQLAEDGWFVKKCRKVNHTSSMVSTYLPSFLKWTQDDHIIDMAVDQSRNILYTLSDKKSCIQVYDLGPNGTELTHVISRDNIPALAEQLCPRNVNWNPEVYSTFNTLTQLVI